MKRRPLRAVDLFCGAGGTTTGAVAAGVQVVLAVNHWRTAIYSHEANHPTVRHICARIEDVAPRHDRTLPDFDLLMASPECTYHSIARGGRPIDDQKRQQPWALLDWIEAKRPRWVSVENVREFRDWGPLVNQGTDKNPHWRPDPKHKGEIFRAWVRAIEALGYQVDWQLLNAADFGAATSRTRVFVTARRGRSRKDIPWPEPTHDKAHWRPAWSIIDWQQPCPSIFGRKRPLAEKTLRRIEAGLRKFVGPFVVTLRRNMDGRSPGDPLATITAGAEHHALAVPFQFKAIGRSPGLTRGIDETVPTIIANQGNHAIVMPFVVQYHGGVEDTRDGTERSYDPQRPLPTIDTQPRYAVAAPFMVPHFGERDGQDPRTHGVDDPLPTVTGQGAGSLAVPFFLPRQGHFDCRQDKPGRPIDAPLNTITANHGPGYVVVPYLLDVNHGDDGHTGGRLHSVDQPTGTICAIRGQALCFPFLTKYNSTGGAQPVDQPLDTLTTRDRYGLAMASLVETMQELQVVDIGFRMLGVGELAAAQGFPSGYYLHGTKAEQIKQVGNSVCPAVAEALCRTFTEAA
jgi:DNA (cytosine-5)-methyltransferase 1